jgi:hypothetical protein
MKKKYFLLLLSCTFSYSQSLKVDFTNNTLNKKMTFKDLNLQFIPLDFVYNENTSFFYYNNLTGFTDKYIEVGNTFYLSQTSVFKLDKRDSFNPNGTNDIRAAVLFGALNLLLKKN